MSVKYSLPLFTVDEGCPFRCIYCNQKKITGQNVLSTKEEIRNYIDLYLSYFKDKSKKVMLCFFGGSFTGIQKEKQVMYLETAKEYIKSGKIHEIGLSTRPDYINDEILDMLGQYNVTTIELGAQSLIDDILVRSKRGHDYSSVKSAVEKIKARCFVCGIQLMPGLVGETDETIIETTKRALMIKPDMVRIYPVLVLCDTQLFELYKKNEYTPISLDKAIEYSEYMLRAFIDNDIKVLRIGLQNNREISLDGVVAAGPFHDSFGQLVISEYILKNVLYQLDKYDRIYSVNIYVGKGMYSTAAGYRNSSIKKISDHTGVVDIKIIETKNDKYYTRVEVI